MLKIVVNHGKKPCFSGMVPPWFNHTMSLNHGRTIPQKHVFNHGSTMVNHALLPNVEHHATIVKTHVLG